LKEKATLTEIRENWTLDDLLDCHDALDYFESLETKEMNKIKKK